MYAGTARPSRSPARPRSPGTGAVIQVRTKRGLPRRRGEWDGGRAPDGGQARGTGAAALPAQLDMSTSDRRAAEAAAAAAAAGGGCPPALAFCVDAGARGAKVSEERLGWPARSGSDAREED